MGVCPPSQCTVYENRSIDFISFHVSEGIGEFKGHRSRGAIVEQKTSEVYSGAKINTPGRKKRVAGH